MQKIYDVMGDLSLQQILVIQAMLLLAFVVCLLAWVLSVRRLHKMRINSAEAYAQQSQELIQLEHEHELERSQSDAAQQRLAEQLNDTRERFTQLQEQWHGLVTDYSDACSQRDKAVTRSETLDDWIQKADEQERQLLELRSKLVARNVELEQLRQSSEEKLLLVKDAQTRAAQEFELLANRIFEDKSRNNQRSLELTLSPLKEQLQGFKKQVETAYEKESRERYSLIQELANLKDLNQQMSQDALNLTKALKGENKTLGNWGELILEKVLEDSGLRKGIEYDTQQALVGDNGERRMPDVIIRLPDQRDLVVDAKASLLAYEAYCNAESESLKAEALAAHVASVRNHIRQLSVKAYQNLEGIRTLDFVFVFLPVEAAFLLAFEADKSLFSEAYERNIIVVSPTTLLATLRTVQNIWRFERQNKNSEIIAKQAGGLHDQFVLVLESLQELGTQINKSRDSYDKTMDRLSRGRGNVIGRTHKLKELGAKTKRQLPESVLDVDLIE